MTLLHSYTSSEVTSWVTGQDTLLQAQATVDMHPAMKVRAECLNILFILSLNFLLYSQWLKQAATLTKVQGSQQKVTYSEPCLQGLQDPNLCSFVV